ncbi:autotransporter-associated beta strand repeat-containing protein [Roseimicrobium gellanilyticum]|nr:autotransporter-associated beta strand repeat-containing protein [Roseimicrobium gellanilyticum]
MQHTRRFLLATAAVFCLYSSTARAATLYWDIDGTTPGAGGGAPAGTWDGTNAFWNTALDGTGTTAAWNNAASPFDIAVFAAGGNAARPYLVTVAGTQNIGGLVFEEGTVSLNGGTLQLSATGVNMSVASNLTASIASILSGGATSTLTKTGDGTLVLSGANTYGGQTIINAGILSISEDANLGAAPGAPVADAITFGGGTLQITGTLTPTLHANRGITINSGVVGTLQVLSASNTVTYGGLITGVVGTTFKKTGAGTLDLSADSTASMLGTVQVDGGTLRLSGNGQLAGASSFVLGNRGVLRLDNSGTNLGNRVAGPFISNGGTLDLTGNAAPTTETLGALTLNAGALTINSTAGAGGNVLTIPAITRNAGGTLYVNGTGLGAGLNQVVLTTANPLTNTILPWAVVNDGTVTRFATHGGDGTSLVAQTAGYQSAETAWTGATVNAMPTASTTTTTTRTIGSLTLNNGVDLTGPAGDRTLNIGSGGIGAILQTGGASTIANNGNNGINLVFGANEALFHVIGTLTVNRGADNSTGMSGTAGFTKSGAGTLILNTTGNITTASGGGINLNEGLLELRIANSLIATASGSLVMNMNGATLRLTNDANTVFNGAMAVNADTTILVDRVNAAATVTTHSIGGTGGGALTLAANRTLSLVSNDVTSGTAYGLTFIGAATLLGNATVDIANNGAGTGTLSLLSVNSAFTLTKAGLGDLVVTSTTAGYSGTVNVQAGRIGWNNASGSYTDSSVITGAGGIFKSGAGTVQLDGNNTFTGGITVNTGGVLAFSTVSNNDGPASNLGQGTNGITLVGGTLSFVGATNQSTNRAISMTASSGLRANGSGSITYAGAITATGNSTLTLTGTGAGTIAGGLIQDGGVADLLITSGNWTFSGAPSALTDDFVASGASTVVNLDSTGVIAWEASPASSPYFHIREGATVNLGANNAVTFAGTSILWFSDNLAATSTLNMNGFNLTVQRMEFGNLQDNFTGQIDGTGTLTVTNAAAGQGFNLFRGVINANLAGAGAIVKQGLGEVTFRGDNSGLGSTTARIDAGTLVLDYSNNNADKLSSTAALDMRGSTLKLLGDGDADTIQSVLSFTLASGGNNRIELTSGTGRSVTLNLGAITRATGAGTLRIVQPVSGGVTTTTANNATTGILGGYLTITDATGTHFARNDGSGNIVALTSTVKNDVSTWVTGDHITNDAAFTGTTNCITINSLRFDASVASTLTIGSGEVLNIASGGILVTSNVTAGPATITGGMLSSSTAELIFTQDSLAQSLTVASTITANTAVTKTGAGTLILSGNNDYTGVTQLYGGTLVASGGNAIGDVAAVVIADDQATTLQITSNEAIGRLSGGNASTGISAGTIAIGTNTLTINQVGGSANGTYGGVFTGSGAIIKNGSGLNTNLSLTGASGSGFTGTVTVNSGLLFIGGLGTMDASNFTINKSGSFMIDNNGGTRSGTRILDTATITLNSADGAWSGDTKPSGLAIRSDQGNTLNETVGVIQVNSGANYTRLEGTATNAVTAIVADDIVRSNFATLNVRGTNMTATTAQRAKLRIGTAANQTTFMNAMVGGGGGTGTKTISIVPWAIAEEFSAGLGDANMGNSLAGYISGQGFRALNLTTEYNTYAASAIATENIREVLTADLTGLASKTINALVIHNNSTAASTFNVTGIGAGGALTVTSGAMLFTLNTGATASTAHQVVLGGFDAGISVGATNEYVFHVVNPSSVATTPTLSVTINSQLISNAHITKSGRGTLVLTGNNAAGGNTRSTTINEGVLEIRDLDNIGGDTGNLVFAGGTLRLSATYAGDDLSLRTISILNGGATIDTNGLNLALGNSYGGGGNGGLTKAGAGTLTLNGTGNYTGATNITAGTVVLGINQGIGTGDLTIGATGTLDMGTFNASVGNVTLAAGTALNGSGTLSATGTFIASQGTINPSLAGSMNFIKQTASQTVVLSSGTSTYTGFTHVQNGTLSIGTLANAGSASSLGAATGDNAAIRLGSTTTAGVLLYTGDGDTTDRQIWLFGTTGGGTIDNDGTGALVLTGGVEVVQPGTKTLTLQGTAGTALDPNIISGMIDQCTGLLTVTKAEAGTWLLSGANVYSGNTNVNAGILIAGNNLAFGTSLLNLNAGTLQGDGTARTLANTVLLSLSSTIGGTSDLTFTGNFSQTSGDRTLTVNNTGITSFTGAFALDRGATNGIVTINAGTGAVVNLSNLQDGAGSGTGSLVKSGVGTLNVSNVFTIAGNLTVSAGIANFSGTGNTSIGGNATISGGTATFSGTGTTTINGNFSGNNSVTTFSGEATTINGNFSVGRNTTATVNYNTPDATLSVGSGSSNLVEIGIATTATSVATLNLSGLKQFNANVGTFSIATSTSGLSNADVTLATNNTITAATSFIFGNSNNSGLTGTNTLLFGSGTNIVTTPLFQVAVGKASPNGSTLTLATGGTFTLNNGAGVATDLHVGVNYSTGTATTPVGVMDLSGGTFIATLDELLIGQKTSGGSTGTATGTLSIGASSSNAITTNTLTIGFMAGGTSGAGLSSGTLNFGGGTFTAAGDVLMGSLANVGSVFGKLNITGGTFTIDGNITKTASTLSTSVLIVDGATTVLDMTGGTINTSQLAFLNGVINNIAAGGVTLDAFSTTNTGTGNVGDALLLRDVTLNSAVTLTGASGGAIHYESANGGNGATVNGLLSMGAVGRTFNIEDSAAAAVDFTLNGDLTGTGGFTKTGAGAMSLTGATAQTYTGATAIQDGRLILDGGADNRIASTNAVTLGAGATSGVLQLGGAAGKSDLVLDSLATLGSGTNNAVVGGHSSLSTLTLNLGANATFAGRLGGAGTNENRLNFVKNGSFELTFTSAGNINGSINVTGGVLNGGFGSSGTTITVAGGAALNFLDGTAVSRTLTGTGVVLDLGAGSSLGFEIGSAVDQILGGASATASVTGPVTIDLFSLGGISAGTYNLISMGGGGLTSGGGSYSINSAPGGFSFSLNQTDTLLQLIISAINVPTMYWRGGIDNSWSTLSGGNTNWTTDLAGTTNALATPAGSTDVIFSATNAPTIGGSINTTLDGSFTVKTLTFTANPVGVNSVVISPGALPSSSLTITPTSSTTGLDVQDNAGNITISAPVVLGADQTWSISNVNASLHISGNISGAFSLTKTGAGTLTLTGTNSYGATTISTGTVQVGNGGTTGTLGSGTVTNNSTLIFNHGTGADVTISSTINGTGTVTKTGAGRTVLAGSNGYTGKTLVNGGTLAISDESALGAAPAAFTADQLTLDGGALQAVVTMAIDDANRGITLGTNGGVFDVNASATLTVSTTLGGTGALIKAGTGTLKFGGDLTLSASTNHLIFGATNGAGASGALDLSTASATFGGNLLVQTNTATANNITIGAGESLTINGNVTIGSNLGVTSATNLTVTGAGTMNIVKAGGVVQVGGSTGATHNNATFNLSGLNSLQMNLGAAGILRIGDVSSTNTGSTGISTMILAVNNTITAGTVSVGDSGRDAQMVLRLGSGTNVINTNTLNVGNAFRSGGRLDFFTTTGTATVRALDGTSRAVMNVGVGGSGTATNASFAVDFTGHSVDLLLSTLTITDQARMGTGTVNTSFIFEAGTLDATTINISRRTTTTAATGAFNTTVDFKGGTVIVGTGGITLLTQNANTGNSGAVNSTLNITGGTVTVNGDIVQAGTGTAAHNGKLNLDGGSLDMLNHNIGGAGVAAIDNLVFASGTLKNVNEINNGADFNKTTTGTLILEGTNNYTGVTNVNAGILQVGSGSTTGTLGSNASVTIATSSTLRTSRSNTITLSQAITGLGAVDVSNTATGITVLTGNNNTYAGGTTVTSGTLLANNTTGSATGTGAVNVTATGTLGGRGFITTSGLTVASGGTLKPGDATVANGIGTLTVTGASTLSASGGSILDLQITHTNGTSTSAAANRNGDGTLNWGVILGASTVAGTSDVIDVVGALTINNTGTTTVRLSAADTGTFEIGMVWDLLDWVTVSSTNPTSYSYDFSALNLELGSLGMELDTSRFSTDGYIGIAALVPEPSRALLLVLGLGVVVMRRRRPVRR